MAVGSSATQTVIGKRQYGDSDKPLTFKIPTDDANEVTIRIYRGAAITLDLDGSYRLTHLHHENEAGAKTMGLHIRVVPSCTPA
jgi:hypothetical protein